MFKIIPFNHEIHTFYWNVWLHFFFAFFSANTESDSGEPANFQRGFPTSALDNPRIVEHPQDNFFAKNEPATLNCNAEGDPTPSITWYRNGERVETNKDDPLSHRMLLDKGQLFFLRVIHSKNNHQDIGEYYCNATNIHGSAISRIANIQIAGKSGWFNRKIYHIAEKLLFL